MDVETLGDGLCVEHLLHVLVRYRFALRPLAKTYRVRGLEHVQAHVLLIDEETLRRTARRTLHADQHVIVSQRIRTHHRPHNHRAFRVFTKIDLVVCSSFTDGFSHDRVVDHTPLSTPHAPCSFRTCAPTWQRERQAIGQVRFRIPDIVGARCDMADARFDRADAEPTHAETWTKKNCSDDRKKSCIRRYCE